MSRHDRPKIHLVPMRSREGKRLRAKGRVVNRKPFLRGVECLELTMLDGQITDSKLTKHTT